MGRPPEPLVKARDGAVIHRQLALVLAVKDALRRPVVGEGAEVGLAGGDLVAVFGRFVGDRLDLVGEVEERRVPVFVVTRADAAHGAEQLVGIGAALHRLVEQPHQVKREHHRFARIVRPVLEHFPSPSPTPNPDATLGPRPA